MYSETYILPNRAKTRLQPLRFFLEWSIMAKKSERTIQRIYENAFVLFERDGFKQTTIPKICEAAGVSRSTFFHYFKSKSAILVGFRHGFADRVIAYSASLPEDLSGKEQVRALLMFDAEQNLKQGAMLRQAIISSLSDNPEFRDSDDRTFQKMPPVYSEVLQRTNPDVSKEYCNKVALAIVRMYWIIWRSAILFRNPIDFKQELSDTLDLLWDGVGLQ